MAKGGSDQHQHQHRRRLLAAAVLLALAYALKFGAGPLMDAAVRRSLEFVVGSYHFRTWQTNRHPYKVDFYFYNWTNAGDALATPRFVEVGPYRFDMFINRTRIALHANASITYSFTKRFAFVKEQDSRFLNDTIVTLNAVPVALAYQARFWSAWHKFAANVALRASQTHLVVAKSVRELLFDGYEDPLLSFVAHLPRFAHLGLRGLADRFGYFYKRNYSDFYYGPYNVRTSVDDNYGELHTIRGSSHTPYFPDECGRVMGKLGEFVNPNHDRRKPMIIYVHDLNIFTTNHFVEERPINSIVATVYAPRDYMFDNGTLHAADRCLCNGVCVTSGLLNSSATFSNAPVFMSLPHFLLGDASLRRSIDLVTATNRSQLPYIAVDQATGILLEGVLTTQLNLLLQPIPGFGMFATVPRLFVPVFSMRQQFTTEGWYLKVVAVLQWVPAITNSAAFLLLLVSLYLLLIVAANAQMRANFNYRPIYLLRK